MAGIDYDYLVPLEAFRLFIRSINLIWSTWIVEMEGGAVLNGQALEVLSLEELRSGFVAYRDMNMRESHHDTGIFIDSDGSCAISVWIYGATESYVQIGISLLRRFPDKFTRLVLQRLHAAILSVVATTSTESNYLNIESPVEALWARRALDHLLGGEKSIPGLVAHKSELSRRMSIESVSTGSIFRFDTTAAERSDLTKLYIECCEFIIGSWFVIKFSDNNKKQSTAPPGEFMPQPDAFTFTPDDRPFNWTPTYVPPMFR